MRGLMRDDSRIDARIDVRIDVRTDRRSSIYAARIDAPMMRGLMRKLIWYYSREWVLVLFW